MAKHDAIILLGDGLGDFPGSFHVVSSDSQGM